MTFSYTDTQMLLYNLSIGMGRDPSISQELPFVYEHPHLQVVPSAAAVLGGGGANILQGVDINWAKLLHGEQRLRVFQPLPPAADLIGTTRISEVVDKGIDKGAIITLEMDVKLANGEPLYLMENVIFCRGDGGCGGPTKSKASPHVLPDREPDFHYVTQTRADQALLYRLNGDRNPLHADPKFAQKAGFEKPILHGLCSYGIACRAVLATVCDYNPGKINRFDVRMTSPVFPGETIGTDIWVDGNTISFQCRAMERDVILISNGRCDLNN
ncbi:MaoC family dehydratase [Halioxenophilus sp. WMMB6]|uniref:MaoC family dehydratase n=1 Tax=Halioxenophilus sp. WMMB6 TaxID=3073815 RepID=UPI00295ED850|nr:MaoC/PaaZ C-terminal domain-containing protein [Halioxenophilus sp. WMMB6]